MIDNANLLHSKSTMPEILLIRHCQATGQAPDAALTQEGIQQAEQLAAFLGSRDIDRVIASPFRRAQQTIEPFAKSHNLKVETDRRLSERDLANPPVENWRDYIRLSFTDRDSRAPGGESGAEVLERAWAAIADYFNAPQSLPVLVTHGHLLALVLNSLNATFGYEQWAQLKNPDAFLLSGDSISQLTYQHIDLP